LTSEKLASLGIRSFQAAASLTLIIGPGLAGSDPSTMT